MNIDQTTLVAIVSILSVTLIAAIALIRNTDTKIDLGGNWGSLTIEGKRSPSLPKETKVDCLPGEEDSQPLNCDSK